mmetsp:Transcript_44373/g.50094  ORF Transcript_44373/g.50094 Transcript_44373/m.50094 type:complete len:142 (+) Transcript_44373:262-687(+)
MIGGVVGTMLTFVNEHILFIVFFIWSWPLMQYRNAWRRLIYETEDWKINIQPWFVRECKILCGTNAVLEREEPLNPELSLQQSREEMMMIRSTTDDEPTHEELVNDWRRRVKKARDFYRFYLAIYILLFIAYLKLDGMPVF